MLNGSVTLALARQCVHLIDEIDQAVFGDLARVELIPCQLAFALRDAVEFAPQRQAAVVEERERR